MNRAAIFNLALPASLHARATPASIALVVDEKSFTYAELASGAGRVAAWLSERATGERPLRVGILASRSYQTYGGILGAVWAGGAYVPLNPKQPANRIAGILEQTAMDALIVDRRGAARCAELGAALPKHVLMADDFDAITAAGGFAPPVPVEHDRPAYIIFTSGTTGTPKGVVVSCGNVAHYLAAIRSLYHFAPTDRVAQFFETTFDPSMHEMFSTWDAGAALHVVPENKLMAPGGFIQEHKVTVWQSVPSVVAMMSKFKQLEPRCMPSLRITHFGGEGAPVASLQKWQAAAPNSIVDNQYGPTEATVACLYHRLSDPPDETPGRGTLAIGVTYPMTEAAIVGPDHQFLPQGETGELAVSGPQLALGYLNDDAKTASRFVMLDHPRLGRSRWYLTGDQSYQDARGLFHCLGRIDNQVKVLGHRVELEEIEAHLRSVCSTDAVAAVAWPASNGNASGIVAFVSGAHIEPPAVREQLRGRVPVYMLPTRVLTLDALPFTAHGKVDRQVLRSMLEKNQQPTEVVQTEVVQT